MNILYVGPLWHGGTCAMRMTALLELGHRVTAVDTTTHAAALESRRLIPRLFNKFGRPIGMVKTNRRILAAVNGDIFDLVWVDKGLTIEPSTISAIKTRHQSTVVVSYSPDDMAQPHNQSAAYLAAIPLYDIHFTTKSFNVNELKAMGATRVCFVGNGFDPQTHRPISVSLEEKQSFGGCVGFIGDFEADRAEKIFALANHGIPVRVWGTNWYKWKKRHPCLIIEGRPLWGDHYTKAICSFEVNLCFLRKANRDRQTTRTVEIPACGAFMLGERSDEHSAMFEEGKEADYFGSTRELLEKTEFYLSHSESRQSIARAGRKRCLKSGYDYPNRMQGMLNQMVM